MKLMHLVKHPVPKLLGGIPFPPKKVSFAVLLPKSECNQATILSPADLHKRLS